MSLSKSTIVLPFPILPVFSPCRYADCVVISEAPSVFAIVHVLPLQRPNQRISGCRAARRSIGQCDPCAGSPPGAYASPANGRGPGLTQALPGQVGQVRSGPNSSHCRSVLTVCPGYPTPEQVGALR